MCNPHSLMRTLSLRWQTVENVCYTIDIIGNKPNKVFWTLTAKRAENAEFFLRQRSSAFFCVPVFISDRV